MSMFETCLTLLEQYIYIQSYYINTLAKFSWDRFHSSLHQKISINASTCPEIIEISGPLIIDLWEGV